ncbi:MAG TPA: 3-oxoacyl-[acyl-carrier-protein] synthase III C-terminal domain-containing protein [Myxococcaceae bacterium]|nr:3-oxoacyl-[acyl-carrier-protein] synthase III C-terminal domain-containing protein [Myxococcaceae bacterium]
MKTSCDGVNVVIRGTGKALPRLRFTTEEVWAWHQKRDPAWLREKFQIDARHARYDYRNDRLDDIDEDDLSHEASVAALADARVGIEDVQFIIHASITPSHAGLPDPSCVLHRRLGARSDTGAMMLLTACAGTLNALMLASSLIRSGQARNVLVCASSTYTSFNKRELIEKNWLHSVIFGDGAAALVVSAEEADATATPRGFSRFFMGADNHNDIGMKKFGGSKNVIGPENVGDALTDFYNLDLRKVPENLHAKFTHVYRGMLERHALRGEDIDWVLFNMSNAPAQRGWLRAMDIPESKSFFNIEKYGNCIAASLGLVLDDFVRSGRPQPGDRALVMSIGSGLQFGGALYDF